MGIAAEKVVAAVQGLSMSVLVDNNTRLVVQGITGREGIHTQQAVAYGTNVVAGVTPARAGRSRRHPCSTRSRMR